MLAPEEVEGQVEQRETKDQTQRPAPVVKSEGQKLRNMGSTRNANHQNIENLEKAVEEGDARDYSHGPTHIKRLAKT